MDCKIINIGSKVLEEKFVMERPNGLIVRYDFIQFLTETKIKINDVEKTYSPGVCILYTPDFPQYYMHVNGWLNHDWIEFECKDLSFLKELKIPLNKPFYTSIWRNISTQIAKIRETFSKETMFKDVECSADLISLFVTISKNLYSRHTNTSVIIKKDIRNLLTEIRLDIYQNPCKINIKQLSKQYGYTETHFCEAYKRAFQVSPHKDLESSRLVYIENHLKDGISPLEITNNLGFKNVEYLYSWFKKHKGLTINEYRKLNNL